MNKYMLDTTIYNQIRRRKLVQSDLEDACYWCTSVQTIEINDTNDPKTKIELIEIFNHTKSNKTACTSFILGVAELGNVILGDGKLYDEILAKMNSIKPDKNNWKDALIAETSTLNKMTLVTEDKSLFSACQELAIPVKRLVDILLQRGL